MFNDPHVIARQSAVAGGYEVLADCQTIVFCDGSTALLHSLQHRGLPLLTQRALLVGTRLVLVDLARLVRSIDLDLRHAPPRDVPGLVLYTLRGQYNTAAELLAAALRTSGGSWWPVANGYVWQASARAVSADALAAATVAVQQGCATHQAGAAC